MRTSLIFTVYNEEKNIKELLDSIFLQTKIPDEIIILDSLSKDKTVKIIKSYKSKKIKLIEKRADIGTARNIAIEKAKNDIILVTDGGCILDKNWVYEISKSFNDEGVDVVGGVFKPKAKNFFEKCQGIVVCKPIEKVDEKKFLPSSRSFAFRKRVWKEIGGYPKHEIGGEDTKFVLDIIKDGYNMKITKKAVVYWRMRSPMKYFIRQYYLYAAGDARMGNILRMRMALLFVLLSPLYAFSMVSLLFLRPLFSLILAVPLVLYLLYSGLSVAIRVKNPLGFFHGITLTLFKRLAYVVGIWREWLSNHSRGYKNENHE